VSASASEADEFARNENGRFVPEADPAKRGKLDWFLGRSEQMSIAELGSLGEFVASGS
jgi:hypothetical protein